MISSARIRETIGTEEEEIFGISHFKKTMENSREIPWTLRISDLFIGKPVEFSM